MSQTSIPACGWKSLHAVAPKRTGTPSSVTSSPTPSMKTKLRIVARQGTFGGPARVAGGGDPRAGAVPGAPAGSDVMGETAAVRAFAPRGFKTRGSGAAGAVGKGAPRYRRRTPAFSKAGHDRRNQHQPDRQLGQRVATLAGRGRREHFAFARPQAKRVARRLEGPVCVCHKGLERVPPMLEPPAGQGPEVRHAHAGQQLARKRGRVSCAPGVIPLRKAADPILQKPAEDPPQWGHPFPRPERHGAKSLDEQGVEIHVFDPEPGRHQRLQPALPEVELGGIRAQRLDPERRLAACAAQQPA
jgi:hypothetical protein